MPFTPAFDYRIPLNGRFQLRRVHTLDPKQPTTASLSVAAKGKLPGVKHSPQLICSDLFRQEQWPYKPRLQQKFKSFPHSRFYYLYIWHFKDPVALEMMRDADFLTSLCLTECVASFGCIEKILANSSPKNIISFLTCAEIENEILA